MHLFKGLGMRADTLFFFAKRADTYLRRDGVTFFANLSKRTTFSLPTKHIENQVNELFSCELMQLSMFVPPLIVRVN